MAMMRQAPGTRRYTNANLNSWRPPALNKANAYVRADDKDQGKLQAAAVVRAVAHAPPDIARLRQRKLPVLFCASLQLEPLSPALAGLFYAHRLARRAGGRAGVLGPGLGSLPHLNLPVYQTLFLTQPALPSPRTS